MYRPYKSARTFMKEVKDRKFDLGFVNYRFKWNFFASHRMVTKYPLHVDIELSSRCNLSCEMCIHKKGGFVKKDMDVDLAKYILDKISDKVYSIKLNWRGEPTLCSGLGEIVSYAKCRNIKEIQMNTNGVLLDKDTVEKIVDNGMDRIIFSVDGHSKEEYEKIRKGAQFEDIMRGIFYVIDYKKQMKVMKPFVSVQMCSKKENVEEREGFKKFWSKQSVQIAILDWQDRINVKRVSSEDIYTCLQPWQRLTVSADGKVFPCCADWKEDYCVGNIKDNSLDELWKGERIQEKRRKMVDKETEFLKPCMLCPRFQ